MKRFHNKHHSFPCSELHYRFVFGRSQVRLLVLRLKYLKFSSILFHLSRQTEQKANRPRPLPHLYEFIILSLSSHFLSAVHKPSSWESKLKTIFISQTDALSCCRHEGHGGGNDNYAKQWSGQIKWLLCFLHSCTTRSYHYVNSIIRKMTALDYKFKVLCL